MRILVTGGLGFLGRAVCTRLAAHGHHVLALSRTPSPQRSAGLPDTVAVAAADLRDRAATTAAVAAFAPQAVCHLAALTSTRGSARQPLDHFDTNVTGTVNLLRALPTGVPFVFTSTSAVYGPARTGRLREDLPPHPHSPYAASKAAAEALLDHHARTGAIGSVTLRCFNAAGAAGGHGDPDTTRILPAVLAVAAGHRPHVSINGDGSAVREFTHVLDVCEAVRLAVHAAVPGRHDVFNVGTGTGATLLDVVRTVRRVTGHPVPVVHRPAADEAHTLVADPSRIMADLGWRPVRSTLDTIVTDAWHASTRARP